MLDRTKVADLPATAIADALSDALSERGAAVVTAPPGAGKSTVLPLTLLESIQGRILMLEPRRIAARQIAVRMSSILGEKPGDTVGYRVRFESCVSGRTRLEVLTEGILTRMLSDDPTLDGVGAVIFDEFHERSLNADVALALTLETVRILRPDLKIVIMSATIDAAALCERIGAADVHCEGRMFPVDIRYASVDTDEAGAASAVSREIRLALRETSGDILAFLPGEADIRRCMEMLEDVSSLGGGVELRPLYGMLPFEQQKLSIEPSPVGRRKVVLSTPIAETSLTIEGVRVVVDSGLYRRTVTDPLTGLSRLETVRISADMASQRSGRAGRVAPGQCRRLWTTATNERLQPCRRPEILSADLTRTALDIASWGSPDPSALPWIDAPGASAWAVARRTLCGLGAISEENGSLTALGRKLSCLPCHPRLGTMLLSATAAERPLAAALCAVTEEKDPLDIETSGTDISLRAGALLRRDTSARGLGRIRTVAEQYLRLLTPSGDKGLQDVPADPWTCGRLLAAAFPERIAKLRPEGLGHYLLSDGTPVRLEPSDPLSSSEWIVAVSASVRRGGEGRVFLAAPLSGDDLLEHSRSRDVVTWDSSREAVSARHEVNVGCLPLKSSPLDRPDPAAVKSAVCDALRRNGASLLDFSGEVASLLARIRKVSSWHPEMELPDLSQEALLSSPESWLEPYLDGVSTRAQLQRLDLCSIIRSMIPYEKMLAVDRLAPEYVTVPTGSRIRLEYRPGADAPVLRVRLQECFGLLDSPAVDDGRVNVLMELLSPGFKPVQLTSDLRSFWSGTYFEVRAELRRRYPRHSWPDDPRLAEPVRGVKRPR